MNKVFMMGRLTRDPEMHHSSVSYGGDIASYSLAVPRGQKGEVDYFRCTAFGKSADFCEKYLRKGVKILVSGHLKTGSYFGKDGKKVFTTDIIVEIQEFAENKAAGEEFYSKTDVSDDIPVHAGEDFRNPFYADEEELPFR